jgi:hypothetical protein
MLYVQHGQALYIKSIRLIKYVPVASARFWAMSALRGGRDLAAAVVFVMLTGFGRLVRITRLTGLGFSGSGFFQSLASSCSSSLNWIANFSI